MNSTINNDAELYENICSVKNKLVGVEKYKDVEIDDKNIVDLLDFKLEINSMMSNILLYSIYRYYNDPYNQSILDMKQMAEELSEMVDNKFLFVDENIKKMGKVKIIELLETNNDLKPYETYLYEILN